AGLQETAGAESLLALVEELEGSQPLPIAPLEQVAAVVATRALDSGSWNSLFERLVEGPVFQRAAWGALGSLSSQPIARVLQVLIDASSLEEAGGGTEKF